LGFAKNIDDLFVGKTLLHGVVLMLLMKTLLTSSCVNQWGAGQRSVAPKILKNVVKKIVTFTKKSDV
ncbi:hypothetical protein, partial [Vagococcus sp. WN89Y]|uniref:hypothetical protein n=1 Tax=Vagococcus sp. WN89Y TaxID=3457258 RepID=UPI003FCC2E68